MCVCDNNVYVYSAVSGKDRWSKYSAKERERPREREIVREIHSQQITSRPIMYVYCVNSAVSGKTDEVNTQQRKTVG